MKKKKLCCIKCRKYKNSERVRNHANECFFNFCQILNGTTAESFSSLFEAERENYLNEHVVELKKERAYANRLQQMEMNDSTTNESPISSSSSIPTTSPVQ